MNLQISAVSQIPIYEQLKLQIREQVLSGALPAGTQLPSIRLLAKELKIGVITSKRAYDDLCAEGILISRAGKGVYVAQVDTNYAKRLQLERLKDQLAELKVQADGAGIGKQEMFDLLEQIYKGDFSQ